MSKKKIIDELTTEIIVDYCISLHMRCMIDNCVCWCVPALGASTAIKEAQWQAREERARQYYERQIEEKKKKLEEQRVKEERRRAAVEEKRRQKLVEDKVPRHTRPFFS